jgi:hypothetical protein
MYGVRELSALSLCGELHFDSWQSCICVASQSLKSKFVKVLMNGKSDEESTLFTFLTRCVRYKTNNCRQHN